MTTVEQAYAEVERLTRARARNFAYGIMLLPKPKRRAIAAIYAFAREVDDVADDPALERGERRRRLEELRFGLEDGAAAKAMFVALADARRRYPIPGQALHDLVDGGIQDTEQTRYATFEELRGYCQRVAGAVGVACVAVYGGGGRVAPVREAGEGRGAPGEPGGGSPPRSSDAYRAAETLGIALQLINIVRDVAEDWTLGRVYLPQDELAECGVSEADIAGGRCTAEWRALMARQAARAREHLADGRTLLPQLDRRSAACVATFANLYEATLERIEERGFDVFSGPPRLSPLTKLRIAAAGLKR